MSRMGFSMIPSALLGRLTTNEVAVYVAVAAHVNHAHEGVWPSHARLAEMSGTSVSTVKRTLNALREKGLVSWEEQRRPDGGASSNLYRLADPQVFVDSPLGQSELPPRSERPTNKNHRTRTREEDHAIPSETASPTESADAESTRRTPPEKRDAGTLIGAWVTGHVAGKNSQPHEGQRRRFAKAAREFVTGSPPLDELAPEQWLRLVDTAYVLGSHCEYAILDAFLGGNGRPPRLPASCCYRIGSRGSIAEAQARNIDQPVAPWEAP